MTKCMSCGKEIVTNEKRFLQKASGEKLSICCIQCGMDMAKDRIWILGTENDERLYKRERAGRDLTYGRCKAAEAWCTPNTEKIMMIPELAEAFAEILQEIYTQPWLGNATTRELLQEIEARIEFNGKLDYKTVDRENLKEDEEEEQRKNDELQKRKGS